MHVARLREKLRDDSEDPQVLLTVRGKGYMFAQAQGSLRSHLQRLPAAPASTDDYGLPYEVLKGYLITTVQNDKVTDASPAPILLSRWAEGRGVDPAPTPRRR